jgi:hypothetical protein
MRLWNKKKKCTDHIVLITTDLQLSASWIVRHYEERPEMEQDYEQMKSGGWQRKKLSATRYGSLCLIYGIKSRPVPRNVSIRSTKSSKLIAHSRA